MAHNCDLRCNAYQDKQIPDMGNSSYILLSWKLFSGLEHLGHGFNENRIPIRQSTFSGIRKMVIQPSTFSLRWYLSTNKAPQVCSISYLLSTDIGQWMRRCLTNTTAEFHCHTADHSKGEREGLLNNSCSANKSFTSHAGCLQWFFSSETIVCLWSFHRASNTQHPCVRTHMSHSGPQLTTHVLVFSALEQMRHKESHTRRLSYTLHIIHFTLHNNC